MSDNKNYEKYLLGEWYEGSPRIRSEWYLEFQAYLANRPVMAPKAVPVYPMIRAPKVTKQQMERSLAAQRQAARRNMLIEAGICTDCGHEPATATTKVCRDCRSVRNTRYRSNRKAA